MLAPARQHAVSLIGETVADQKRLGLDRYAAVRPQTIPSLWSPGQRLTLDCSDYCRFICRNAGIPDPAGNSYEPFGNSSSIWLHLHHIPIVEAQPADIVTFGYVTGEHHASILYSFDPRRGQWQVGNFGAQGQPIIDWLAQEISYHAGMTVTVCRVEVKDPPPTAADRLRAMTGFYAWVAWRLGEGPWRHYIPRTPSVRPDVPALIPLAWWVRFKQFEANRHKPDRMKAA